MPLSRRVLRHGKPHRAINFWVYVIPKIPAAGVPRERLKQVRTRLKSLSLASSAS